MPEDLFSDFAANLPSDFLPANFPAGFAENLAGLFAAVCSLSAYLFEGFEVADTEALPFTV